MNFNLTVTLQQLRMKSSLAPFNANDEFTCHLGLFITPTGYTVECCNYCKVQFVKRIKILFCFTLGMNVKGCNTHTTGVGTVYRDVINHDTDSPVIISSSPGLHKQRKLTIRINKYDH